MGFALTKWAVLGILVLVIWLSGGMDIFFREPALLIFAGIILLIVFGGGSKSGHSH